MPQALLPADRYVHLRVRPAQLRRGFPRRPGYPGKLSKGCAGPEVKTVQRIIFARGINKNLDVDGAFGDATKAGVIALQKELFPNTPKEWDGIVGVKAWKAMLTKLD